MSSRQVDLEYVYRLSLADKATAPLLKATRQQEQAISAQERALRKVGDTTGRVSAAEKRAAAQTAKAAEIRAREAGRAADREIASLKATGRAHGQLERQVTRSADRQRRSVKGLVGALGGLGAAYGAYNLAKKSIDTTEELTKGTLKLQRLFGLSDKTASAFVGTAIARGTDAKQTAQAFGTLSSKLTQLEQGGKGAERAFAALDLDAGDLAGKPFADQLDVVSDALERMPGGAAKAAAAKTLLGRGFQTLLPMLNQGADGIDRMTATAEKYGVTLDGKAIRSTEQLIAAQREADLASLGLQLTLGRTLVPALTELTKAGNEFVLDVRRDWPQIKREIEPIVSPIVDVAEAIGDIGEKHPALLRVVGGMAALGTTMKAVKFAGAISGVTTFLRVAGRAGGLVGRWSSVGTRAGGALATSATDAATGRLAAEASEKGAFGRVGSKAGRALGRGIAAGVLVGVVGIGTELGNRIYNEVYDYLKEHTPSWFQKVMDVGNFLAKNNPITGGPGRIIKGRRAGGIVGFQAGGLVPAFVSSGEEVHHRGSVWTVPGPRVAADNVFAMLPAGAAVVTGHGQRLMAHGASLGEALASQAPHFASGGRVSKGGLKSLWSGAGGPGSSANLAAAVALAESAGDPRAVNRNRDGSIDRGLWQINSVHGALSTFDPVGNARAAVRISGRGRNWRPWAAFTSGRHRQFLDDPDGGAVIGTQSAAYRILGRNRRRMGILSGAFEQGISAGQAGRVSPGVLADITAAGKVAPRTSSTRAGTSFGGAASTAGGSWTRWQQGATRAWADAFAEHFGLRVTSAYRTPAENRRAGGVKNSLHMRGTPANPRAFDFVPPKQAALTAIRERVRPRVAESMIHDAGSGLHLHVGMFRRGGLIGRYRAGGTLKGAVSAATGFEKGALTALDHALASAAEARLLGLRSRMLREARKGGDERTVKRFQQVASMIDAHLGFRIGRIQSGIERRTARSDFATGLVDRRIRGAGIDAQGTQGLRMQSEAAERFALPALRASLRDAQAAVRKAQRAGASQQRLRELQQGVTDAIVALDEGMVAQVERRRQIITRFAQDRVDDAQFRVDWNTGGGVVLEAQQRVAGTFDTAAGMRERAGSVLAGQPALEALKTGFELQAQAAQSVGDIDGWRNAMKAAQGVTADLANAQANAAELIRQAADRQVDALAETADFQSSRASTGLETLTLQQQLAGTEGTAAGGIERASYIRSVILPALQAEAEAQRKVADERAREYGADSQEARAAQLKLDQDRNEILKAQLDAQNEVKKNTEPLRDLAGSSTFDFRGERFVAGLLGVGNGA